MDRSWMSTDRLSLEYAKGVKHFLEVAERNAEKCDSIRCPCKSCGNCFKWNLKEIKGHLYANGIDQSYRTWIWHGEDAPSVASPCANMGDPFNEGNLMEIAEDIGCTREMVEAANEDFVGNPEIFKKLLEDAHKPLYKGCKKFTKLSALVSLFNLKAKSGWTDTSFSNLLELLAQMLPEDNGLPLSTKKALKTLSMFGMGLEKIHACPNDCILYRKEYKDATVCPSCGTSRYKLKKNTTEEKVGVPAKVLWYFPPIPRFKRWFQSAVMSKDLTWHANEREVDGKLRHPADSPSWKLVDDKWPEFGKEAINLRLALLADGINPHSTLSSRYSCWPVMLVTYNLPPSLSMKRKFLMLTMLISGPQQPGNDIDVYLEPLIEDLKTLWEDGVHVYDAHQQESFTLKAVLLWTINDFPAYGNLCGCAVKGYYACPICGEETVSVRLKNSNKNIYTSHRRFLPPNHPFRKQKKAFNGQQEFREQPKPLSGEQIFEKVKVIKPSWGKNVSLKRKRDKDKMDDTNALKGWKKKSIFFELEYWKHLLVRHNLDIMHIEKNVCDNIIGTLPNIPGKTKDGVKSRLDLVDMGLREDLAPQYKGKRTYLPAACYTLSREEKKRVCETLLKLKVPDGYSSNFSNLVSMQELKLFGLKSHDCHILMQQILPVAIRSVLPKHVRYAIIRVCFFFNALCAKAVDVKKLKEIQNDIVVTLCLLEKYFPPSFFDIMVHLMVHLVREVELCGPVFPRWMFSFERNMCYLKGQVNNRNYPEGCIAHRYIAEEAIEFCTEFLHGLDAVGVPFGRNTTKGDKNNGICDGKTIGGGNVIEIDGLSWEQAHRYVLQNTNDVQPYIEEHMESLRKKYPRKWKNSKWLQEEHNKTIIGWLREKVEEEQCIPNNNVSNVLKWVSRGPRRDVIKYPGYIINGCRYHTKDRDAERVNQNSGVSIMVTTMQVASAKDKNPVVSNVVFYGVITEIWMLDYITFKIPIFKCDWVDSSTGIKIDELGFTSVDLGRIGHKNDPFILASHAKQVFYVPDQLDPRWSIVLVTPQRVYNHDVNDGEYTVGCTEDHSCTTGLPDVEPIDGSDESQSTFARTDCEGIWIDDKL